MKNHYLCHNLLLCVNFIPNGNFGALLNLLHRPEGNLMIPLFVVVTFR